jgi:hypothetical protein
MMKIIHSPLYLTADGKELKLLQHFLQEPSNEYVRGRMVHWSTFINPFKHLGGVAQRGGAEAFVPCTQTIWLASLQCNSSKQQLRI